MPLRLQLEIAHRRLEREPAMCIVARKAATSSGAHLTLFEQSTYTHDAYRRRRTGTTTRTLTAFPFYYIGRPRDGAAYGQKSRQMLEAISREEPGHFGQDDDLLRMIWGEGSESQHVGERVCHTPTHGSATRSMVDGLGWTDVLTIWDEDPLARRIVNTPLGCLFRVVAVVVDERIFLRIVFSTYIAESTARPGPHVCCSPMAARTVPTSLKLH